MDETVVVPIELKKRMIRIKGLGQERRVLLDELDISRYVSEIDIKLRAGLPDQIVLKVSGFADLTDGLLEALVQVEREKD